MVGKEVEDDEHDDLYVELTDAVFIRCMYS